MKYIKYIILALVSINTGLLNAQANNDSLIESIKVGIANLDNLEWLLILIALLLLIPIKMLGGIFLSSYKDYYQDKLNKKLLSLVVISALTIPMSTMAQGDTSSAMSNFEFVKWFLTVIILVEVSIISFLSYQVSKLISRTDEKKKGKSKKSSGLMAWWKKSNNFVELSKEGSLDTGHDYDGIKELDNKVPQWFSAAFVASIIFAIFYMWQYHIAEIAPLQDEEYQIEVDKAEIAHEQYLKYSGSSVDENSLAFSDIIGEEGKTIFDANCATCHQVDGGGSTGPNLADNAWIYGCSPKDIYQSIKYGRKNGMMAWKDNLNDKQILALMDYVHSFDGTKPAAPKEAQGEVCNYSASVADTTAAQ